MKNFFKSVADCVFSFGMFMFLFITAVIGLLGSIAVVSNEQAELTQLRVEACYAQGMVLVLSDAGQRCVLPQSLVKVK
jgi:uncharacterized BrkB/YihY/UPF0761 family membrane protein